MFKKFQDLFFKEDIDELNLDDHLEEAKTEEDTHNDDRNFFRQRSHQSEEKELEKLFKSEQIERPNVQSKAVEKTVPTAKITLDIVADEFVGEKEIVKKERSRFVRKDEFEMPQVISPYYGIHEENTGNESVKLNNITSDNKRERFNDVISPIYGKHNNDARVVSETILNDKEMRIFQESPVSANNDKANEPVFIKPTYDTLEEEEVNLALDEIIAEKSNDDDDLIQFSLFGENKRIQEETFENEDVEDKEDSLPF